MCARPPRTLQRKAPRMQAFILKRGLLDLVLSRPARSTAPPRLDPEADSRLHEAPLMCSSFDFRFDIRFDPAAAAAPPPLARFCPVLRDGGTQGGRAARRGPGSVMNPSAGPGSSPGGRCRWARFSSWLECVCVVTFDLELGQALEVPGAA